MKAILFDFGNTLVRQDNLDWSNLIKAGLVNHIDFFRKRNIKSISFAAWSRAFHELFERHKKIADRNFVEIDIQRIFYYLSLVHRLPQDMHSGLLTQLFYLPICRSRLLFDDVIPALNALQRKNIKIGLLSNTVIPGDMMNEVLERLQILDFFSFTLYSSDIGYRKPHASAFEPAVSLFNMKPSQIIMVGDQPEEDIKGAASSGLKAVLIERNTLSAKKKSVNTAPVISSLSDLISMIGKR